MNRFKLQYRFSKLFYRVIWFNFGRYIFNIIPNRLFFLRNILLRIYGAKIGRRSRIYNSALIHFPKNLVIGNTVVIGRKVEIKNHEILFIGNFTTISQGARLIDSTHDFSTLSFPLRSKPITIGDNVWIAQEAFVGPGVTIKSEVVLGARAVCFKSLDKGIYIGNPIKSL